MWNEKKIFSRKLLTACSIMLAVGLNGCAKGPNPQDPYENFNRKVYKFNDGLDKAIIKPVAHTYNSLVPWPARQGVSNFFSNVNEVPRTANNFLQANFDYAISSVWRLVINSTVGIGGLFDVASKMGLEKRATNFGVTLSKWGLKPSPYLELPLLGPSTFVDTVSMPVEYGFFYPYRYMNDVRWRNGLIVLRAIDMRSSLLDTEKTQSVAALDPYVFRRNAYLQYRERLLNNAKRQTQSEQSGGLADYEEEWEE